MKSKVVEAFRPRRAKPDHSLQWLAEPLTDEPTFVLKSWFGGRTIMLHGRHHLFLTTQGEPWQGVLVCTAHEHHESLRAEFPALAESIQLRTPDEKNKRHGQATAAASLPALR